MNIPDRLRGRLSALLLALVAAAAVLLPGSPAWAHNALADATPAKNATVKKAPTSVKLKFLQKLNPAQTSITITGAGEIAATAPKVDGATGSITFEPLMNGAYTVTYAVVSKDGHPVQGSYEFTVADPAASAPAPTASASTAPTSAVAAPTSAVAAPTSAVAQTPVADEDAGSFPTVPVVIGALVLVLAVGGGLFFARRRRNG